MILILNYIYQELKNLRKCFKLMDQNIKNKILLMKHFMGMIYMMKNLHFKEQFQEFMKCKLNHIKINVHYIIDYKFLIIDNKIIISIYNY